MSPSRAFEPGDSPPRRGLVVILLLFIFSLSFAVREVHHQRTVPLPEDAGSEWFSADPDGLYHMRRVERALRTGLPVAPFDPLLAFPAEHEVGTAVPWPPYYTLLLYALIAPWAPAPDTEPQASRAFVEHAVATWPAIFSALTSCILLVGVARLCTGRFSTATAWFAGTLAALCHVFSFAALRYSMVGNGDHHAFVSCGYAAFVAASSLALRSERLADTPRCFFVGTLSGLAAGVLLGSWVAALELLALFDVALLLAWCLVSSEESRGLAVFGAMLHGTATLVLLPAVAASPWALSDPTSIVELTWIHPALSISGFLFFASPVGRLVRAGVRRWPAAALGAILGFTALAFFGPRSPEWDEALTWALGRGAFMGFTNESRDLLDSASGTLPLFKFFGYALPLAAAGWLLLARRSIVAREWLPCAVAFPVLVLQASMNRRFAELAVVPALLALGFGVAFVRERLARVRPRIAATFVSALFAALVVGGNTGTLRATWLRLLAGARPETGPLLRAQGERELHRWMRAQTPDPGDPPSYGVLAQWDLGHGIVWGANRPVVATNFGSYVGLDSYLDPGRFFLELDEVKAEELLSERRVRYVVLTSRFRRNLGSMVQLLHPDGVSAWLHGEAGAAPRWLDAMGGRLVSQMGGPMPAPPTNSAGLGFLRLVYVSPDRYRDTNRPGALGPAPIGSVFERVAGAYLEAQGAPGDVLRVSLRLRFPGVERERVWRSSAPVDGDGVARVRVPYAAPGEAFELGADGSSGGLAEVPAGASGPAVWSIGARRGEVAVPESVVQDGGVLELF